MPDRFAATIDIGDEITNPKVAAALITAIADDGPRWEWGEPSLESEDEIIDLMQDTAGGTLRLVDEEARYGQFDAIESACRELGLSFVRHSEARYEYDGELVWWQPGMNEVGWSCADQEANPLVAVSEIRRWLEQNLNVSKMLDRHTPPEMPPFKLGCTVEEIKHALEADPY